VDDLATYHELCGYTLSLRDAAFVHQHVVDAWAVQRATPQSKPIATAFGLVGLYLHLERGFTGRQVQLAHVKLARTRRQWPVLPLPGERGAVTVFDVMAAPPGHERDRAIHRWCASVWNAVKGDCRTAVVALLEEHEVDARPAE
jgi:hypothetical protein